MAATTNNKLTCLTCQVVFTLPDLHRTHFQSDWHRYNLKRKVAELDPITLETFDEKAAAAKQAENGGQTDQIGSRCGVCAKSFASNEQLENHLQSRKHKEMCARKGGDVTLIAQQGESDAKEKSANHVDVVMKEDEGELSDWTDESEDDTASAIAASEDAIAPTSCLFCDVQCADIHNNTHHMFTKHGFFVLDLEYCTNVFGLLEYLGYKVGCGHECVHCLHPKNYRSIDAVRKHMRDKGHTTLRSDTASMLELDQFYDYSTSYPTGNEKEYEKQGDDDDVPVQSALDQGWQLQLPSGATVGHRSLQRYYRQYLRPVSDGQVSHAQGNRSVVDKLMLEYSHMHGGGIAASTGGRSSNALSLGISKELAGRKARDQRFMHRHMQKHSQTLGVHNNYAFKSVGRGKEC